MAQNLISSPPTREPMDEFANGQPMRISQGWASWLVAVFNAVFAIYQSGTTAQRPTVGLWIGRPYFDTDLAADGKPIWYNANASTGWCDATGAAV